MAKTFFLNEKAHIVLWSSPQSRGLMRPQVSIVPRQAKAKPAPGGGGRQPLLPGSEFPAGSWRVAGGGQGLARGWGAAPDSAADAPWAGGLAIAGVSMCRQVGSGITRP